MFECRIHWMTKTIPACVLLIPTILLQFASGAAINTTSSTNLSAIDTNFCTDDGTWTGTGTRKTDCMAAVQRLYDVEVKKHGDEDFEFLSVAAWAKGAVSSIPPMQTPRKYAVGSCTVVIAMLNFFRDGALPGEVEGPHASRDVTSYLEIWQAASRLQSVCLLKSGKSGWAAEGGREAIGIFMWGTNSLANAQVPPGALIPPYIMSSTLGLNSSLTDQSAFDSTASQ